jgi:hypothetical protein
MYSWISNLRISIFPTFQEKKKNFAISGKIKKKSGKSLKAKLK